MRNGRARGSRRVDLPLVLACGALAAGCGGSPATSGAAGAPPAQAGASAGPAASSAEEWDRELPAEVERVGDSGTHWVLRVVGDEKEEPVARARVRFLDEAGHPGAEPWDALENLTVLTDRDGYALARAGELGPWMYVEADGWAPAGNMGLDREWRLPKGRDVPVEVRDWADRPVAGVTVEYLLGCGHTPHVRVETTGRDGRAVLRGIDAHEGSTWLRGDTVAGRNTGYAYRIEDLPTQSGSVLLRAGPSWPVEGRVFFPDGSPAANVPVGTRESHRGPWARTDSAGRFRLLGTLPFEWVEAEWTPPAAPGSEEAPEKLFAGVRAVPGVAATLRLAPAGASGESEEGSAKPMRALLRVAAKGARAAESLAVSGEVRVVAVREADGFADVTRVDLENGVAEAELELSAGWWTVTAGSPAGPLQPRKSRVEVTGDGVVLTMDLPPNPAWRPRVRATAEDGKVQDLPPPWSGDFRVLTAESEEPATLCDEGRALRIPAQGAFVVEYEEDGRRGIVRFDGPLAIGAAEPVLVLPPPEPRKDTMTVVPYKGDFPTAKVTVLLPDGKPAAEASYSVSGRGPGSGRYVVHGVLDADGTFEYAFKRRDRLRVHAKGDGTEGLPPLDVFIDQKGPWTLRWPKGGVDLRAEDEKGKPLAVFEVVLEKDAIEAEGGAVRLRGRSAGPVRLWVNAEGRRSRDLRLVLHEGEVRAVRVRMNPR